MLASWPSTTLPLCLREVSSLGLSFPCRPGQTGQQVRAVWVILGSCLWQWPEFHARCFLGEQLEKEKLPGGLVTAPDDVVSAGSGHWFVLEMSCLWWSPVGTRQAGAFRDQQHSNWLISQSA